MNKINTVSDNANTSHDDEIETRILCKFPYGEPPVCNNTEGAKMMQKVYGFLPTEFFIESNIGVDKVCHAPFPFLFWNDVKRFRIFDVNGNETEHNERRSWLPSAFGLHDDNSSFRSHRSTMGEVKVASVEDYISGKVDSDTVHPASVRWFFIGKGKVDRFGNEWSDKGIHPVMVPNRSGRTACVLDACMKELNRYPSLSDVRKYDRKLAEMLTPFTSGQFQPFRGAIIWEGIDGRQVKTSLRNKLSAFG